MEEEMEVAQKEMAEEEFKKKDSFLAVANSRSKVSRFLLSHFLSFHLWKSYLTTKISTPGRVEPNTPKRTPSRFGL